MNYRNYNFSKIFFQLFLLFSIFSFSTNAQTIVGVFDLPDNFYFNRAYGLTSDSSHLYLSSGSSSSPFSGWIYKFDLNGAKVDSFSTGLDESQGLAWDGSHFWYCARVSAASFVFYKITTSGTVVDQITLPSSNFIGGLYWDGNGLWYSLYYPNNEAALYKMDVNTQTIVDTISTIGTQPQGITFDGQYFYYAMDDNDGDPENIYIYDPAIEDTVGAIPIADPISTRPRGLAWDGGHLWLVADPVGAAQRALFKFDLGGGGTPNIDLPVSSVDFGLVEIGQTGVNQFSILNIGDGTLSIDTLEFNNELFGSNVTTFPLEIQANSSATIDLNFTPAEFGRENGEMIIHSNDPFTPLLPVDLTGKGLYADPTVATTDTLHDFGNVWVAGDGISSWDMGIINQGIQSLQITDLTFSGDPVFSVDAPALPFTVAPDDTVEVTIWFAPQQGIFYQGSLNITSNDPATPVDSVALQGTGVSGPFSIGHQFWHYQTPENPFTSNIFMKTEGLKQMGDVTGDGINEVITSNENYLTICINGASANEADTLWSFNTGIDNNNTGSISLNGMFSAQKAIQIATDLNGDGLTDVVFGTDGGNEHVYALDGATGAEIWSFGDDNDPFLGGFGAVDVRRDLNGDMVPDVLAVSSSNSQGGGRKTVYLFDGTNGNFLWQHPITVPGLASGYSVISIEDVTGDNIPDAVAGYGGDGTTQFARGLDGSNGQTLWQFDGPVDGAKELLELPVAGQTPDVIVANFFDDIYRVNGEDGQQLWNFDVGGAIIQMNLIPDVNNNGIDDILVASFSGASQIYCLEGETGLPIWTSPTNDYRSYGVQAIPDINGDGIYEAIAGDQSGTVYVISGEGDSLLYTRTFGTRVTTVDGLKSIDGNDSHEVLVGLDDGQIFCLSGGEPLTGIRPNNDNRNLPGNFSLAQNYPNPFNPTTTIEFSLPERSNVSLVVMDLLGRKVKTIYDKKWFAAGVHEISFDGRELPSGIYFYQMEAGKFSETRKMILMK